MSFYTALTGLNAATSQLGVTSNNIANVSTVGFKRSRTDFGDIFATSPLQKATSTIGQGVSLKQVSQEFSQGNMVTTSNTLDLAISGDGFFHVKSQDGFQDIYTRNGVFMLNDQYNVVNSAGQKLIAASVDSSGKANLNDMNVLTIPQRTTGMAKQTSKVSLGLNLPSDATVITKPFDRADPTTYNKSTALTVYDAGGNSYLASIYYVKTQDASSSKPTNKWQTFAYIGDQLVGASLQQATNSAGDLMYVNKYGQLKAASDFTSAADQAALMSSFAKKTEKFSLNDLTNVQTSAPASVSGSVVSSLGTGSSDGVDMSTYSPLSKGDLLMKQGSSSVIYDLNTTVTGDTYSVSYGGSSPVSVSTTGTTPPSLNDVVNALNQDSSFSSKYVAQATTTVTISSPLATSTTDFKDISLTLDGKSMVVPNINPKSSNLSDIASALQERLRSTDGERSNLSVNVSDNGKDLVITDSLGREISGVQIHLSTNATNGGVASGGLASPSDATSKLQITSVDPNITSAAIKDALTIKKTVGGVDASSTITSQTVDTNYTRATANYSLAASATSYSVSVGSGANAPVVTAATNSGLADALNANTTFAANYKATWDSTSQTLSVTAIDPSATYDNVSNGLSVFAISGTNSSQKIASTERSAALFNVTNAYSGGASVNVYLDSSSTPLTLTPAPTSSMGLVDALNTNTTFSASYTASLVNGQLKIVSNNLATPDVASHFTMETTSASPAALTPVITQGNSTTTESAVVTFNSLEAGQSVTIAGLTYTSTGHSSAAQVANAFSNVISGGSGSSFLGSFTGSLTGYSSGGVTSSNTITFTSTSLTGNVPDLTASVAQASYAVTSTGASVAIMSANAGLKSADDLRNLFQLNVDGSNTPVTVSLDYLAGKNIKLTGTQLAQELTNEINRNYGDEKPFNFYGTTTPTFTVQITDNTTSTTKSLDIDLTGAGDSTTHNMRNEDLVAAVQSQIDSNPDFAGRVKVTYDTAAQKLVFTPTASTDKMTVVGTTTNSVGLTDSIIQASDQDSVGLPLIPNVSASPYRVNSEQRYGITVQYDAVKGAFVFNSGTTGDTSSIAISHIKPNSLATQTDKGLGLNAAESTYVVAQSKVDALRGMVSTPAILTGNAMSINANNNFSVDATNNTFVVSVNGVTGTVTIPPKDNYTIDTFTQALQNGINGLESSSTGGLTPETVNGVKVTYDSTKNALVFTTGTASSDTYIKVTGNSKWGLTGLDAQFGKTSTWIKPTQSTDATGAAIYIDALGNETTSATGFDTLPAWSPVYLKKGELTFDTSGNLVSPKQGSQLDTVYLPNGKGALTINIDYSKSTQYASAFSVLSQSQDGSPEGDLVSLAIKEDGLVQASYSNGAEKSLAKIVLANFSNPTGLRQIGDTNYYATSSSGTVKYGEAGSAGYGTVRSGATERANVDLTQELVDLITEQRNFQASAKAMETDTQMTQTIIQIRN